jgi:hypothetical protein
MESFSNAVMGMSYLYSKLPETGVPRHIGTGGAKPRRLLFLGVLRRRNLHPYEIKRRLMNAMGECCPDVDVGTLYYAIRQLAKDRLISTVAHERGAACARSMASPPKARSAFRSLLHESFRAEGPAIPVCACEIAYFSATRPHTI